MQKYNSINERIKQKYFIFLKEAKRLNDSSVDAAAKALNRFEVYANYKDFKKFHFQQAIGFKKNLAMQNAHKSGEKLSKATLHSTLLQLKNFFQWLSREKGYKSIQYSEAEFFNLSGKETRIATAKRQQSAPTIDQIKSAINKMPTENEIERRDRALIAFTILTGARDSAIASMKLKHIDLVEGCVYQDAREVNTKFSKTFNTYFFPVGSEIKDIFSEWVLYLQKEKNWGSEDPLFPKTLISFGPSHRFEPVGLAKEHWKTAAPIRTIFKNSFFLAGLPYYNPHSFRNTLAKIGEKQCRNPEEFKAWSQNLGHEKVLTTFMNYGEVGYQRQQELIQGLATIENNSQTNADKIHEEVIKGLRRAGIDV